MVHLTKLLLGAPRGLSHKSKFLDRLRVYVRGGAGGQGYPKYGGMGGDGGNVIFKASEKGNLYDFVNEYPEKRFIATPGQNSKRMVLLANQGDSLELEVPPGVVLSTDDGATIGELNKPGDKCIVAKGGSGGGPMNKFKTGTGQARSITIELKLLADVGLVGFPNAGKSTLLSAISRAKPKIADYPFTTIRPQLGMVQYEDGRRITVADLPGLIEGAHANIGMGHHFLKHLERTKLLLVVVDLQGFLLNHQSTFRDAFETTVLLNKELELYKPALLQKPQVLLLNKTDKDESGKLYQHALEKIENMSDNLHLIPEDLRPSKLFDFQSVLPISALSNDDVMGVKQKLRDVIDSQVEDNSHLLDKYIKDSCSEKAPMLY